MLTRCSGTASGCWLTPRLPSPPEGFNAADLHLLPKTPKLVSEEVGAVYLPECTRPLSVVNAGNRLLAGVFRDVLQPIADRFVVSSQRGFLKGRSMVANVVDMDDAWRLARARGDPGLLLFLDVKAAFPSFSHDFMFRFLEDLGVPPWVLTALQRLR